MKRLTVRKPGLALFLAGLAAFAAGALGVVAARAQSQSLGPPWDYPPTLGVTPIQVLAADLVRLFINPSATVTIDHLPGRRLSRALAMLHNKKLENPWKKQDNIPL
jgi:hypothetical protein